MSKRLGLVLECDAGGPDELIFKCLSRRLSAPDHEPEVIPVCLGSKKGIMEDGVSRAESLVTVEKCDLVLVVWDLKPLWSQIDAKRCVHEADDLRAKLANLPANVRKKIRLLCLTWELETWLLAEDRAIREYLSTPAHSCNFTTPSRLHQINDPKSTLNRAFTDFRGKSRRYVDWQEAIQLVQLWADSKKVQKVPSFARFAKLITDQDTPEFRQCGAVCANLVHQAGRMGK